MMTPREYEQANRFLDALYEIRKAYQERNINRLMQQLLSETDEYETIQKQKGGQG